MKNIYLISFLIFLFGLLLPRVALAQAPDLKPSAELMSCFKQKVGEAAFNEISTGKRISTSEEVKKGETCFDQYGQPGRRVGPPGGELGMDAATISCLKNKVGERAFSEISVGKRGPTPKEMEKGEACFRPGLPTPVEPGANGPPDIGVSSEEMSCVKGILGEERFQQLGPGRGEPSDEEKFKLRKCFPGRPPGGKQEARPPEEMGMTPETLQCVKGIVGEERFKQMGPGGAEPTDGEKQKLSQCFPAGGEEGRGGPPAGITMAPQQKDCVLGILGSWRKPSDEEEKRIGQECMGGEKGIKEEHPNLSTEQRSCVEKILSGWRQPTKEEEERIGRECGIGGPGPDQGQGPQQGPGQGPLGPGPNQGPPSDGTMPSSPKPGDETGVSPQPILPPEKEACIKKILGGTLRQLSPEEQIKIDDECFR